MSRKKKPRTNRTPLWRRIKATGERFEIRFCRAALWLNLHELDQVQESLAQVQAQIDDLQAKLSVETQKSPMNKDRILSLQVQIGQAERRRRELSRTVERLLAQITFENYISITGCRNIMTISQNYQNPVATTAWLWVNGWWRRIDNPLAHLQRELGRIRRALAQDPCFQEWEEILNQILDTDIAKLGITLAKEILPYTTPYIRFDPDRYRKARCYPVFCRGKHFFVFWDRIKEETPPRKRHYNLVGLPWRPQDMPTPAFQKWLDDLFDLETQKTIWQVLAWIVTPVAYWPHIVFIYGDGGTGKSTFLRIIRMIVGASNISAVPTSKINPTSTVRLTETMVNVPSEGVSTILPEDLLKAISDQEAVEVRPLYRDYYTAVPTAKLIQAWNKLPPISDFSQGFWRRLILIPFTKQIQSPDPHILNRIRKEIPGILYRLIFQELPELLRNGGRIYTSEKVRIATATYKEENSSVLLFFKELQESPAQVLGELPHSWEHEGIPGLLVARETLYKAFVDWCVASGLKPLAKKNFFDALQTLGDAIPHTVVRPRKMKRTRCLLFYKIQKGEEPEPEKPSNKKEKKCGPECEYWIDSLDSERCVREGFPGIKVQTGQTCLYQKKDTLLCVECVWLKNENGHGSYVCKKATPPIPKTPRSKACHAFTPKQTL